MYYEPLFLYLSGFFFLLRVCPAAHSQAVCGMVEFQDMTLNFVHPQRKDSGGSCTWSCVSPIFLVAIRWLVPECFKACGLTQLIDKMVNSPYIFVLRSFSGGRGLRLYTRKAKTVSTMLSNLDRSLYSPVYCRLIGNINSSSQGMGEVSLSYRALRSASHSCSRRSLRLAPGGREAFVSLGG